MNNTVLHLDSEIYIVFVGRDNQLLLLVARPALINIADLTEAAEDRLNTVKDQFKS
jgi:hypothetical protein